MPALLRRLTAPLLLWLALLAAPAHALDAAELRSRLGAQHADLGSSAGALVVDAATGRTLFSRRPDLRLVPASNEKLFTTAATLLGLGGDTVLQTRVVAMGLAPDGASAKELFVVGAGDPTFANTDLDGLAKRLRAGGLRRVTGAVAGDESALDTRRGGPDSAFKPDFNLGGQLGALVVGHGTSSGRGPAAVVAERLQAKLKALGVTFGRAARVATAPEEAVELTADASPPVAELVRVVNQASENFYAELLLKVVGAAAGTGGSTAGGAVAAKELLEPFGVAPTLVDGSGLSRANKTTAREVVTLLTEMGAGNEQAAWRASLTVAGRNGTLRRRMRGTSAEGRCRGKTGTLRGVSALSGYCTTTTGRRVVFSFLENGVGSGAKSIEDRLVTSIARYEG